MADPTVAAPGAPSPGPTGPNAPSWLMGQKEAFDTKQQELLGRVGEIEKAGREQDKAFDAEEGKLHPPHLETPPPPNVPQTNPQQVWASQAMAFAAIASAFTRTPLTTAFNAAAQAIQGFHQGDVDAVNQATKTWEIASRNAIETANFQQKAYDEAMAGIERRRTSSIRERAADLADVKAQMTALASSFRDDVMMATLEANDWYKVNQIMDARKFHADALAANMPKIIKGKEEWAAIQSLDKDPSYIAASPGEKIKRKLEVIRQFDGAGADKARQIMVGKFDASIPGKAYQAAKVASDDIDAAANAPDILTNPVSQIALIDKIIFAATGSVRPGMAQYAKLLSSQNVRDVVDMTAHRIQYHPVLGPNQIHNIVNLAHDLRQGTAKAYADYLNAPDNHDLALNLNMVDESGRLLAESGTGGGGNHQPTPGDIDILKGAKGKKEEGAYKQFFDRRYGQGAAERILGEP